MNRIKKFFILFFILTFAPSAFASANLDLWKRDYQLYGYCGHCAELLSFTENKNRASFSEYSLEGRAGYYTINLKGSKGVAVTLFGLEDFKTKRGYLVIVKEDDQDIEITNLEGFSSGKWTTMKSETGGQYSVYYDHHQDFKSLITSVQWGKGPQS
jgi:hypothetical protein